MWRADSSAAAVMAAAEYRTPWWASKWPFSPRSICMVCSTVGSATSIFWKRRDRAWSFSKMPRYSLYVVAPRHLSCPEDRSEEHTSELQSLMRTSYAVFCLKKKKHIIQIYKQQ